MPRTRPSCGLAAVGPHATFALPLVAAAPVSAASRPGRGRAGVSRKYSSMPKLADSDRRFSGVRAAAAAARCCSLESVGECHHHDIRRKELHRRGNPIRVGRRVRRHAWSAMEAASPKRSATLAALLAVHAPAIGVVPAADTGSGSPAWITYQADTSSPTSSDVVQREHHERRGAELQGPVAGEATTCGRHVRQKSSGAARAHSAARVPGMWVRTRSGRMSYQPANCVDCARAVVSE
jgi:hypothetical protein